MNEKPEFRLVNDKTKQDKKQDRALWDSVTKDVTPLKNKNTIYRGKGQSKTKNPQGKEDNGHFVPDPPQTETNITIKETPAKNTSESTGIDHRTQQRLKRGKMPIDGRLDLHGKTQSEAYDALMEFIPSAHAQGKRCLLVITGKGLPRHGDPSLLECSEYVGVLKQKTPQWLNSAPLNRYILDIQPARPNHGGEGALYVLLRRRR